MAELGPACFTDNSATRVRNPSQGRLESYLTTKAKECTFVLFQRPVPIDYRFHIDWWLSLTGTVVSAL